MGVSSLAMRLIILPVSLVNIAISVNESAVSMSLSSEEPALIDSAIFPDLPASALPDVVSYNPLAIVPDNLADHFFCSEFQVLACSSKHLESFL